MKKLNALKTIGDIVVGTILPTKAPPLVKGNIKGPIVQDILRVGAGAALASSVTPALFKMEVNMNFYKDKNPNTNTETVINIDSKPIKRAAPTPASKGYIALPEKDFRVVDDHPIDLGQEIKKAEEGKAQAEEIKKDIKEVKDAVRAAEAARTFMPPPHQHQPEVISPILGTNMDILKREDDDPPAIDLSPGAVYSDKQVLDSMVQQMVQPPQYPAALYPPVAPGHQYPPITMGPSAAYPMLTPMPPVDQKSPPDNVSLDASLIKFDQTPKPKPNQWPDTIQQRLPNAEKIPFVNKYDNSAMFIKFPDLAFVQQIAEVNKVHVLFSEVIFENNFPDSRVVRVDSYNEEGQHIYFKSFFIDFGNIIDRRIKVFPNINHTLEGQQAFSFYYIPNRQEKNEGNVPKNKINDKLFQALFSGGVMMLEREIGLYKKDKIAANRYCVMITVPNKNVASKDRNRIITMVENMAATGGVFETALQYCPGSRWKFESNDDPKHKTTAKNFILSNLNVATNYGSIPKAVKACRIISCEVDKQHKIIVDIEGFQQLTYTVDSKGLIST